MSLSKRAITLAEQLLVTSREMETSAESAEAQKLARLMEDDLGKELTFHLTDQVFRSPSASRSASLFRSLIDRYGAPSYLSSIDKALMMLGAFASRFFPGIVMPAITRRLRKESEKVILPAENTPLRKHLAFRREQGAAINLNLLGEAVLGEKEAQKRLQQNIHALTSNTANYISIKLSSIFSQINLTAYHHTQKILAQRLRQLYRAAQSQTPPAFVNLDMEEYRDLHLTLDVFKTILDEPEFLNLRAGIVLQAYLPDSYPLQIQLTEWARTRVEKGGAPIKVRLVKGANLAMEKVDAELHHWPQAPYLNKAGVDANFKRMLHYACDPENAPFIHLGVASHNLFDLAYALLLREENKVQESVELEMLEGMAAPQARAILEKTKNLLFYAPVVHHHDFDAAIAYLIRRLDENTTPGNFLNDLFDIAPGNPAWESQKQAFLSACAEKDTISQGPNRQQDRRTRDHNKPETTEQNTPFQNEPDTDFSLPQNREWLYSYPAENHTSPVPHASEITAEHIESALETARTSDWKNTPLETRAQLLRRAAHELAAARLELIHLMNHEANKSPQEADVEISEAIDFANYYANSFTSPAWQDGLSSSPRGPILITPPWNFPCAIPCGGILASLIGGNPTIIKPAPETVATAKLMVDCLWRAGIPKDALQYLPAPDNELGQKLITDERITSVILTGSSHTANMFLNWRPHLHLAAETSGKNSLIITSAADPDLAIKDLVKSAFHHSGQKCSAASIALVERPLYRDSDFLERLRDAAASLSVGPATDYQNIVTPLIQDPSPDLLRGLTQLDQGEKWLLQPSQPDPSDPTLWSPGIRIDVKPGSWIHNSELFGPVLALIPFDTLDEAISIQNATPFALTGGIHSLDPAEIKHWKKNVHAGNAYINRPITGAIVQTQPFGGWKQSSIGPGAKAGGPNYVAQFIQPKSETLPTLHSELTPPVQKFLHEAIELLPEEKETLTAAAQNAAYWWREEFSQEHDPTQLRAESNTFRYLPVPEATLRLTENTTLLDSLITTLNALTAGVTLYWSQGKASDLQTPSSIKLITENDTQLQQRLKNQPLHTLRSPGMAMTSLHPRNHAAPVTPHAYLELMPYLLEQSISQTQHRHGRLLNQHT